MKPILSDEETIRNYLKTNSGDCFETLYNRYMNRVYGQYLAPKKNAQKLRDIRAVGFIILLPD